VLENSVLQCVVVCCSVLQCVAVCCRCCSVLQCVAAVCYIVLQIEDLRESAGIRTQGVAGCCSSALQQCVAAVCCSRVLQCVALV